jgi:ketosteroid isomerase-like protein
MSQENVEMVRREYVALAARDWVAIAETWHPDIELEALKADPEAGTYRGLDEITRYFDTWSEPYSEYRVEADEILDAGDRVVAVERVAARGLHGSDTDTWMQQWLSRLIQFKEGKIWRVKEYSTRAQALEAAGLKE